MQSFYFFFITHVGAKAGLMVHETIFSLHLSHLGWIRFSSEEWMLQTLLGVRVTWYLYSITFLKYEKFWIWQHIWAKGFKEAFMNLSFWKPGGTHRTLGVGETPEGSSNVCLIPDAVVTWFVVCSSKAFVAHQKPLWPVFYFLNLNKRI